MKKILLASSALVAAGLVTAGPVMAASKIHMNIDGWSRWWTVGVWNSNSYLDAHGIATPNVDEKGDNQINFNGSTTLDNGMKVGLSIQLEGGGHTDMTTDTIDKSFAWVEGSFGKFILGTDKATNYLMGINAPVAGGSWNDGGIVTGGFSLEQPTLRMGGGNTTRIATTNNSTGIEYYTPRVAGFTLGLDYIPKGNEDFRGAYNLNGGTYGTADMPIQGTYGAGLLYANTFNGVGVKASANVSYSKLGRTGGAASANSWMEQSYGANVSFAGITVGGSYRRQRANYDGNATLDLADLGNASIGHTTSGAGSMSNGSAYDAGVQYATGPYAVSFDYFHSAVNVCNLSTYCTSAGNISGTSNSDIYQLSGKYNVGPGIDIVTIGAYGKFDDGNATSSSNKAKYQNSGWVFTSGLMLSF